MTLEAAASHKLCDTVDGKTHLARTHTYPITYCHPNEENLVPEISMSVFKLLEAR